MTMATTYNAIALSHTYGAEHGPRMKRRNYDMCAYCQGLLRLMVRFNTAAILLWPPFIVICLYLVALNKGR